MFSSVAPKNRKTGSWKKKKTTQPTTMTPSTNTSAAVKYALPLFLQLPPLALAMSTAPPMPQRIARKTMMLKNGLSTAIAAAPIGPTACPTAMVSTNP